MGMCPIFGGKVGNLAAAAAQAMLGVRKIAALEPVAGSALLPGKTSGGVAVIADTLFHAMRALAKVEIEWDHGAAAVLSSRSSLDELTHSLDTQDGKVHFARGDAAGAMKAAAKVIEAESRVSFLAHAA